MIPRITLGFSIVVAALLAAATPSRAQTIQGALRDRESDRPIGFGRLVLLTESGDSVASAMANQDGLFTISARQSGSYYLKASALGYKETTAGIFDLDEGGSITLQFRIYSAPITLDGVVANVNAPIRQAALIRNGFYDRMTGGMGRFLTPADIEKSHALTASELLLNIPRVSVPTASDEFITMLAPLGDCVPMLYVDGIVFSRAPTPRELPSVVDIEAIEVYRGAAEVPLQWGGTAAQGCGAIVIWTKGA